MNEQQNDLLDDELQPRPPISVVNVILGALAMGVSPVIGLWIGLLLSEFGNPMVAIIGLIVPISVGLLAFRLDKTTMRGCFAGALVGLGLAALAFGLCVASLSGVHF